MDLLQRNFAYFIKAPIKFVALFITDVYFYSPAIHTIQYTIDISKALSSNTEFPIPEIMNKNYH